jgi:L-cysteine S-thiosulfotransferase
MAGSGRSPPKSLAERLICGVCAGLVFLAAARAAEPGLVPYAVVGDAIPASLTGKPGDAARGGAIVADRRHGLCLLCHPGPFPNGRLQGSLAPDLSGVGSRLSAGQLRLRIVDAARLKPDTIMPSYYRTEGLTRVARSYAGKPILDAEQIEDVVAFLLTLKTERDQTGADRHD